MTTIKLDPGAALLLDALHGAGHAAYAVGGCVRDSLLGLDPHDWDLCTSARPEQVMALFGEEKCIPTGLQHGTVTVKQGGRLYETTTFRTEGAYSDGRHPDAVCFVPDVREDLARRDFTINAMAYSAEEGLIDPFGGRDDLAAHLVRAVGEPERRFEEDALRILRLYRFAARFGFAIDPATGAAARALGPHLDCVSAERIQEELLKLLAAPRPGSYLEPAVLAVVLPELEPEKQPERFAELCRTIDRIEPTVENVPARLAALLCPLGEAGARKALRKLKCSNALTDEVTALEREAPGTPGSDQTLMAKRLLGRYELPTIQRLTALCSARHPEQTGAFAALRAEAERLTAENACCRVSQLAVNGRDLMAAGVRPGPGLRQVLNALLEAVITGQTPNEKDALLAAAAQFSAS
ncbi:MULTISPECIES: CCA tRNA nucleotidyltransferase [Faecalibacterium]|uniref:CCA tRNA nucleotidyltransferase n=1 Tax=Faecalibacterium TaxID=216851 RepID=UPI0012DE9AD3|nr:MULTISPECIES: CCA tRNA nucleotidyltransferase [Faecalibacterium]MBO1311138.1 CCA tRNA nucleotidyltransferase [Faecalibacterium sp. Marseille-Q4164]